MGISGFFPWPRNDKADKMTLQVEQAELAARNGGVKLEKWRQVTGLERWKDRIIMVEEDEGIREDGGKEHLKRRFMRR